MEKSLKEMTSAELFNLAEQKKKQEHEKDREAASARIEALRAERRQLNIAHKKAIAAIDREIRKLDKTPSKSRTGRRNSGRSSNIVSLLKMFGPLTTADLKKKMSEQGIDTKDIGQSLAYLKRRGIVTNPQRALYDVAK